jgi:hypothetical protein
MSESGIPSEDGMIDCMDGLRLIYDGQVVEGTTISYVVPQPTLKDCFLIIGDKRYKFVLEEIV